MKTKILLQTLCISLLFCFFIQAQGTEPQNIINAPTIPAGKDKIFSFPLISQQVYNIHQQLTLSVQLSESNRTVPVYVNMRSSGLWMNNYTGQRPEWNFNFHCERSQTCKPRGPAQYHWIEERFRPMPEITVSGSVVKEKVNIGNAVLPNIEILMANEFSHSHMQWDSHGGLGLNFRRSHPTTPTFFEYLKTESLVDKSIFSIYIDKSDNGELMFGGYDAKRAESGFEYTKWQEDESPDVPGFSLKAKRIGYGNDFMSEEDFTVIIDFEYPDIEVPEWIWDKVYQEEYVRGLNEVTKTCNAIPFLKDIVIEFEDLTLRIPPAAYNRYGDVVYYDGPTGKEMHVTSCAQTFYPLEDERSKRIVLGRPFLKFFYTVFNHEDKTVGFSRMTSLLKEYPFSEPAGDYQALHYFLPLKVGGALAVLLIAKFCVIVYFIRKTWKGPETSSAENLASPKIDIGTPVYSGINNQDSQNIDVGKITIEEEKFYA